VGGVQRYSSNYNAETTRRLLRQAGFELIVDEIAALRNSSGDVPYLWVMGRTMAAAEREFGRGETSSTASCGPADGYRGLASPS